MKLGMKLPRGTYCKLAMPSGWDFYTGRTINYRDSIGKKVSPPGKHGTELCSSGVLHASRNPNNCFIGASIPCSAYLVRGKPVVGDSQKSGFWELTVVEEVTDLDSLFGWRYLEAVEPIHPFRIARGAATKEELALLKEWDSVRDSVRASVWDSVRDSVGASVRASVWDSVGASVGASVWDSVRDSVRASVWDSVRDSVRASVRDSVGASVWASVGASVGASVWAYLGSLFPLDKWKYVEHEPGRYPFETGAKLWRAGLVPSFDEKVWRLHGGPDGKEVARL